MTEIISRTAIGLSPTVKNFNRITKRPALKAALGGIVCHYTGVKAVYGSRDTPTEIRKIDRWKPNEYNYVIDTKGMIYEFAGQYQAAHAKGYNHSTYGVLFLNGVGEACTDAQITAFRWLRDVLVFVGAVVPNPWILQHGQIAATACPGPIKDRWSELTA